MAFQMLVHEGQASTINTATVTGSDFDHVVTILMENNGLCNILTTTVGGCSGSGAGTYMTSLAGLYGLATHYTAITHPSEPNYLALIGGSTFGYTSDGNCCYMISSPNIVDRLESAGLTWQAFAEGSSGSGTCSFMPPRSGDHFPFIDFSDMNTASRCGHFLTTASPTDSEFLAALNSASPANYIWLTPNDNDNCHDTTVSFCDAYLAALVPLILSSTMFTNQRSALFIVFDEGKNYCPTGNNSSDCVYAAWAGPVAKNAVASSSSYSHYSYLHTVEANWNLATLTSNDSGAATMGEFFGTNPPPALSSSFTFVPTAPVVDTSVSFSGSASGGTSPYSYSWNFGDGSTGTGSSVTHSYSSAGSFSVVLTVADSGSPQHTVTSQKSIAVSAPPSSLTTSFTYSPSMPQAGQQVSFTGSASGGTSPYSYTWSFGDGSTGSGSSAAHTYSSSGSYTVVLTVKDTGSPQQTATSTQTVSVSSPPPALTASFSYSPASPQVGQQVTFTASASGGTSPYTFSWSFGDGSTGTGSLVTHTYSSSGSYTVILTVNDSGSPQQTVTSQQTVSASNPPPLLSVGFTYSPPSPEVSQQITFTASGSGGTLPYSFSWSFGDGSSSTSNPATHTYSSSGSFTVTVTVTDASGANASSSQSVSVASVPSVSFGYSPASAEATSPVTFSANATGGVGPFTFSWAFGDGGTSTSNPAIHTYTSSGSSTVVVTVTDADGGQATSNQTINVATPLGVSFSYSPSSPTVSQAVSFTATTSGGVGTSDFIWSFGDGSSSTANPAAHTYTSSGLFKVTVTATDTDGVRATLSQTITVASALSASFAYSPSSPQVGQSVSFSGSASGGTSPYSYSWSFGDGSNGTSSSASHTYSSAGSFTVTLTVKDSGSARQTATSQQSIAVSSPPPTLSTIFAYSPSSPQAGQQVSFNASAIGGASPYSFSWNFGDNSSSTGNPTTHIFTAAGSFLVSVTTTDAVGVSTTSNQTVTVAASLSVSFTFSPSSPHAGDNVTFVGSASGGIQSYNYFWSFGDSTTGSGGTASHIYQSDGHYTVTMIVTDASNNTANNNETITVKHIDGSCHAHADCASNIFQKVNFNSIASSGTALYIFTWLFASFYNPAGLVEKIGLSFVIAWKSLRHRR
jgi:PKD repeat protein